MRLLLISPNISDSVSDLIRAEAQHSAAAGTEIEVLTAPFGVVYVETGFEALIGAFAMGVAALAALWLTGVDFLIVPQGMMHSVNSFPLMSIPFFMLAGELMIKSGIVERLIALANAVVGRVRGGMAHVTMLSGAVLATVSGAEVSDASAPTSILVPSLSKIHDRGFATAIVAANLGPIIPPSGAMIVYAFMAGVVPGITICIGFMLLCSWIATRRGWGVTGEAFRVAHLLGELRRSLIVLAMPVIVIGGIVGRAFTATEGEAMRRRWSRWVGPPP